jgi:peroxiredoxin family protein
MYTLNIIIIFVFIFVLFFISLKITKLEKEIKKDEEKDEILQLKNKYKGDIVNYINNQIPTELLEINSNPRDESHEIYMTFDGLEKIKNYIYNKHSANISYNNIDKLINHSDIRDLIVKKELELIDIIKEHSEKLIKNSLVTNLLEIPNREFTEDYLEDFKHFLLKEENINVGIYYLKEVINEVKFKIYRKEILDKFDISKFNNLKSISEVYLEIYGYNTNTNYIKWIGKISTKDFDIDDIINEIRQKQIQKRKNRRVDNIANVINSSGNVIKTTTLNDIDIMTGEEFEYFLKDLFKKLGYDVQLTKLSGDQGADLIIERELRTAVQAKRYSNKVTNTAIQEVVSAKKYYNTSRAMVVTNNYYTKSAKELAKINDVELWNREDLKDKLLLI